MDPDELFRAVVALNALFASLAWCLARPNMASMLAVVTFAILWPFVDKPLGGRTIHVVSEGNGITTGDFLTVLALAIVAVQAARQFRRTQRKKATAVPPSDWTADVLGASAGTLLSLRRTPRRQPIRRR